MNKLDKSIREALSNYADYIVNEMTAHIADKNGAELVFNHIQHGGLPITLAQIKATILQEIKKEMPLNIPKTLTDDNIPDWLKYGVVCEHDDWTMCGHRANYLITTLKHLLGDGE